MRIGFAAVLVVLVAGFADRTSAIEYPWCAEYSIRGGATNCGFSTYEQCRATVFGVGGFCRQNTFYRGETVGARPRYKKRRVRH